MIAREAIVAVARSWVGTPYHHQASLKGIGCDCLGLIRGVWRECCGPEPEAMPAYTRDWGDATGSEPLLAAAAKHLVPLSDPKSAQAGDILVFRMKDRGVAKHAGILVFDALPRFALLERDDALPASGLLERARLVHAQEELGVVEVELGRWWRRRVVAAFSFPGVN